MFFDVSNRVFQYKGGASPNVRPSTHIVPEVLEVCRGGIVRAPPRLTSAPLLYYRKSMEASQQQDSDPASASNRLHGSPLQSASKRLNLLESERWALKHLPNGFLPSQVGNACAYVRTRVSECVCVRGHRCGIHNSLPYCCETIFFPNYKLKKKQKKRRQQVLAK